jgi:hypothetical protein
MKTPIRSIRIRLRPENKALYVTAHLFPTRRDMWRAMKRFGMGGVGSCGAAFLPFTRVVPLDSRGRVVPQFGVLFLNKEQIGCETISHEVAHATHAWARRVGWKPDPDEGVHSENEERWCYAHGEMVRQLVNRLYGLGCYDEPEASA